MSDKHLVMLDEAIANVQATRSDLLFDDHFDEADSLCPLATQHWLTALAQLELARLELEKAKLWQGAERPGDTP